MSLVAAELAEALRWLAYPSRAFLGCEHQPCVKAAGLLLLLASMIWDKQGILLHQFAVDIACGRLSLEREEIHFLWRSGFRKTSGKHNLFFHAPRKIHDTFKSPWCRWLPLATHTGSFYSLPRQAFPASNSSRPNLWVIHTLFYYLSHSGANVCVWPEGSHPFVPNKVTALNEQMAAIIPCTFVGRGDKKKGLCALSFPSTP